MAEETAARRNATILATILLFVGGIIFLVSSALMSHEKSLEDKYIPVHLTYLENGIYWAQNQVISVNCTLSKTNVTSGYLYDDCIPKQSEIIPKQSEIIPTTPSELVPECYCIAKLPARSQALEVLMWTSLGLCIVGAAICFVVDILNKRSR